MAFASHLAAMNAANKILKALPAHSDLNRDELKALRAKHFSIEKHDGEWHALIISPLPSAEGLMKGISEAFEEARALGPIAAPHPAESLKDEREGHYPLLTSALAAESEQAAFIPEPPAAERAAAEEAAENAPIDPAQLDKDIAAMHAQAEALANAQQATSELKGGKLWIHASSCKSPVKRVWAIADAMIADAIEAGKPLPSRKEAQEECERQGVASGTARTQYQAWKKAKDNTLANAEHAAKLSAAINGK